MLEQDTSHRPLDNDPSPQPLFPNCPPLVPEHTAHQEDMFLGGLPTSGRHAGPYSTAVFTLLGRLICSVGAPWRERASALERTPASQWNERTQLPAQAPGPLPSHMQH